MPRASKPPPPWQFTEKDIKPQELAKHDNFIVSMMVESFVCEEPLKSRKLIWPGTKPPKPPVFEQGRLLQIIKEHVLPLDSPERIIRENMKTAIDSLIELPRVTRHLTLKSTASNRNEFITHLAHYCMLYLRNGPVEIVSTDQFVDWTGEPELSLVATEPIPTRTRIPFLTSSISALSQAQEKELGKHGKYGPQNFSVFAQHNKKGRLLLGPVRFANHNCKPNAQLELQPDGRTMCIRSLKIIPQGAEITVSYGDNYFGKKNGLCLCITCREQKKGGSRFTKEQWERHMRYGGSIETVPPPEAHATDGATEQQSEQTPHQKYSRELKGITDRRHFEGHPKHDSVFNHRSATASRSTSAVPSTTRKAVVSAMTDIGTDLEVVPEASSADEDLIHKRDLHLGARTMGRVIAPRRGTTGKGKGKMKMKTLPQTDPEGRLAGVTRKEGAENMLEDNRNKERETVSARSGRCTRSQLGRTAPPEVTDAKELCQECMIRACTSGARDCARCRRHAQIYGMPWPKRYDPPPATFNNREQLKRKREDEPGTSRPKKRTRPSGALVSIRIRKPTC